MVIQLTGTNISEVHNAVVSDYLRSFFERESLPIVNMNSDVFLALVTDYWPDTLIRIRASNICKTFGRV